jgi:predicted RNA-binding Zn ribbon-like protein
MEEPDEQSALELCLDFSNTINWRNGKQGKVAKDKLVDYESLVDWSKKHELFKGEEARRLNQLAKESGKERLTLKRAVELRETIYRVFSAIVHGKKPDNLDLEALSALVAESVAKSRITRAGDSFEWSLQGIEGSPDRMLWPIARSAADLLTSDRLEDVRECANEEEGCGWLFLDCTKNHTRRWCSMEGCGNVAKARRFYEKHKKVSA